MNTTTVTAPAEVGPWDVNLPAYYADYSRVSHSMLEDFRQSPATYHAMYVAQTMPPSETTGPMRVGSAFHCYCLEPGAFTERFAVAPGGLTRMQRKAWAEFEAEAGLREVLTAEEMDRIIAMTKSVLANDHARRALELHGHVEQAIRWTCPDTGLALKAMCDKVITEGPSAGLVIDFKSMGDSRSGRSRLDSWAWSAASFGYHRQAAYYAQGARLALSAGLGALFIVVGSTPPYETSCHIFDGEAFELGVSQNRKDLRELADCLRTGQWHAIGQKINRTTLPRWAFNGDAA